MKTQFKDAAPLACAIGIGSGVGTTIYDAAVHMQIDPAHSIFVAAFVGAAMLPLLVWNNRNNSTPPAPQP